MMIPSCDRVHLLKSDRSIYKNNSVIRGDNKNGMKAMVKNFYSKNLIFALFLVALVAVFVPSPLVCAENWKGWNIQPPGYPVTVGMESFLEHVEKVTDGRIIGRVYNNGVLGDQNDAIQMLQVGGIQFAEFNLGPMGTIVPELNVVSLPFIFKSVSFMHRIMDGPVGKELSKAMAKKGIIALAWYDSGARSFYNIKHPINKPSDMKGMKIRVMDNQLYVNMVRALGGNATPMAFSEVYQALKTRGVDGAENSWPSYDSTNHYEIARYYSLTEHLILPEVLCVSKVVWDRLSASDQKAVKKAAEDSVALERELWVGRVKESREKLIKAGVIVNQIRDKAAFQEKMKSVYTAAGETTPSLIRLVKQIQNTR